MIHLHSCWLHDTLTQPLVMWYTYTAVIGIIYLHSFYQHDTLTQPLFECYFALSQVMLTWYTCIPIVFMINHSFCLRDRLSQLLFTRYTSCVSLYTITSHVFYIYKSWYWLFICRPSYCCSCWVSSLSQSTSPAKWPPCLNTWARGLAGKDCVSTLPCSHWFSTSSPSALWVHMHFVTCEYIVYWQPSKHVLSDITVRIKCDYMHRTHVPTDISKVKV